jgi:hypothetical protein
MNSARRKPAVAVVQANRAEGTTMKPHIVQLALSPHSGQELGRRVRLYLRATRLEFAAVKVEVIDDSIIRLSGSVGSYYSRQLAVATAKRVAGVRHVIDEILVSTLDGESTKA